MNDISASSDESDCDSDSDQRNSLESRWDIVDQTGSDDDSVARAALDSLLGQYHPALQAHLRRKWNLGIHEAEEIAQEFAASKLVEGRLFERADREKGRLRTFLYTAIDRFFIDQRRAQGRRPSQHALEDDVIERDGAPDSDALWAQAVITDALRAMREDCQNQNATTLWSVFYYRIIAPIVSVDAYHSFDKLAQENGLDSATAARNKLVTAKRKFRQKLLQIIENTVDDPDEVEDELKELAKSLESSSRSSTAFDVDSSIMKSRLDSESLAWDTGLLAELKAVEPHQLRTLMESDDEGDSPQRIEDELQRRLSDLVAEEELLNPRFHSSASPSELEVTVEQALTGSCSLAAYELIMKSYSARLVATPSKTSLALYLLAASAAYLEHDAYIGFQSLADFGEFVEQMIPSPLLKEELRQRLLDIRAKLAQL